MAGLGKSASDSSLRAAGASMTHIPKRATQHSVHLQGCEVLPPDLKIGQLSQLSKNVFAEEARDLKDTYLNPDRPQGSVYAKIYQGKPEDYIEPRKPVRQREPNERCGHRGTEHWGSEYKNSHNSDAIANAVYHRQDGPSYQAANPPTCVGRGELESTCKEFYGKHGSNPLHRIAPGQSSLPVFKTSLTIGTAKGTNHIPGYQGFMPHNTSNPYVARVASGANLRVANSAITDQFHTQTLGYSGHIATNPNNVKDNYRIAESTMGRSFRVPALNAFP